MMRKLTLVHIMFGLSLLACTNASKTDSIATDTLVNTKGYEEKSYISMFEIPATDIARAIKFYEAILDVRIEKLDVEEMEMGILPYENQLVTGVIIKAEGYQPSAKGVTIYLNAGDNLQAVLDKVEPNGGKMILPKTAHADNSGYFAIILDSEGNRIALNSPQ